MRKRNKLKSNYSKKMFTRNAKTHPKNNTQKPMRGGIRL